MGKDRLKLEWLKTANFLPFSNLKSYSWCFAPSKEAIFFSLRTIIASYLALTIALWMELDSPKWALMTVWIVSQTSPGETISKSKWRVVGTLVGVIIAMIIVAAFPQEPILFGITMAIWMGGCCWIASLIRNSSSYGFVLAGYTCALIGLSSISDPNNVFMTAVARGSYIILGVLCQSFVERLFAINMHNKARFALHDNLLKAISGCLSVVTEVLKGDHQATFRVQQVFSAVAAFQNSIEFRKAELVYDNHVTDHVHATLSSISIVLTRLINLTVYMSHFPQEEAFQNICFKSQTYLENLVHSLSKDYDFQHHLNALNQLRWDCRQLIADCIYQDTSTILSDDVIPKSSLDARILYRSLSELLGEIEVILKQYQFAQNPPKKDNFTFTLPPLYNFKLAAGNGLRVFLAVLGGCLLWEITAWDQFPNAIGLLCVACGRLCLFENGYKMSLGFLKGVLIGILISALLDVTLMAVANTIEMIYLALFIPLFIGGLAIYNLPTRGVGMCFNIFFPFMLILGNQAKMDEITFLNSALSILCGVGLAVFAFRFLAPYSPQKVRHQIRVRMVRSIHVLPEVLPLPNPRRWLASTMDWFVSLMRQFDPSTESILIQKYNHGALAVMSIGLNIMELREMIKHDVLSKDVKMELRVVMRRISHFRGGRYGRTALIAKSAVRRLREREKKEKNLAKRLEITAAIACLILIFYALEKNVAFLNPSYRLYKRD
ncbi:FUSC family protein [Commensalibacter oyaizuii]|uniref:FUSC family protein n=1 Tax=Commensalibacter oyaizuii TaxID=3043873 RepID=A0ABT6Q3M6_9PROT|nr:FUSC family protein [Commensalibacter sp. TBRC 16381]MDI2091729.1 FUSC family protein [Commensalibacter sp. TBRC 16381]